MRNIYLIGLLLILTLPALAQETESEVPPPPPMSETAAAPPPLTSMEDPNAPDLPPPTVTIRREDGKLVEEYRSGGVVYMVRVTPEHGVPYMLIDMDGDGILEKHDLERGPNIKIPMWPIYEWE